MKQITTTHRITFEEGIVKSIKLMQTSCCDIRSNYIESFIGDKDFTLIICLNNHLGIDNAKIDSIHFPSECNETCKITIIWSVQDTTDVDFFKSEISNLFSMYPAMLWNKIAKIEPLNSD